MEKTQSRQSMGVYVHVLIILALMFGFRLLPPMGMITPLGMQTIGIFAGIIYGWSTMGMIWPSFLGLLALGLLPGNGVVATFKAGFGDRVTVAILMFLLFSNLLEQVGLSAYIAKWCTTRKFTVGRPWAITIMFCVAGALISAFVNIFAGMILMWGVFYEFCEQMGFKKSDIYPRVTLVAIIYCCCMAGGILPFMGLSLLVVGQQINFLGYGINYVSFTLAELILTIIAAALFFLVIKFVIKPDISLLAANSAALGDGKDLHMTGTQKQVSALLVTLMLLLFLPGILPKTWLVTKWLSALDIAGAVAVILIAYYILNLRNDEVVPFTKITHTLNWDLILVFATVAPLSVAVANGEAGILATVSQALGTIFNGMNPYVFTILIILIGSIITQFANNAAIIMLIMPIMYTFALDLGANPLVLTVLCAFNLNNAFCTPAASGPAAIIFSNREWIPSKDAYQMGFIIFIINMLVTVIGLPLAELLF